MFFQTDALLLKWSLRLSRSSVEVVGIELAVEVVCVIVVQVELVVVVEVQ